MNKKSIEKEKNPLLKNLNTNKMTSSQIQEEISKTEKLMQDYISKGKYPNAESCNEKIEYLKKILKEKKIKEVNKRHYNEKENLKQDQNIDINSLNELWDKKYQELQAKSQSALDELKKNQQEELKKFYNQYQESPNDVKPSATYLKLKKEEEGLVKLKKFKEAEVIRKKREAQMKIDSNKNGKNKESSFKNIEKRIKQKHENELTYLKNKFQAEFDELAKSRQKDVESLNKKYSVKNKDLVNQQKREDNINKSKNYEKRIEDLQNNYEQRFIVGKREYVAPEPQTIKYQIYAEIRDNNNLNSPKDN